MDTTNKTYRAGTPGNLREYVSLNYGVNAAGVWVPMSADLGSGSSSTGDSAGSARESTQQQVASSLATLLTQTDGVESVLELIRQLSAGSARENTQQQVASSLATLLTQTDGVEGALELIRQLNAGSAREGTQQQVAASLATLLTQTDGVEGALELIRQLLAGTLSTKAVALPARQSVIRTLTGNANTAIALKDHELAPTFATCTVLNIKNLGTADLLIFNTSQDPATHSYPLPAGQGIAADLRFADLNVISTAAVKLAVWGGKDAS